MIFENGFCKPNGASDFEDSSFLAGILAVADHPLQIDMRRYVDIPNKRYYRHPNTIYDCSRDQGILIMCGLLAQGHNHLVKTSYITGKDILLPSVHGIQTIAETGSATWLQKKTFHLEVAFKCRNEASMIGEPFQDLAKAIIYDDLKFWTQKNYLWDVAILRYLRGGDCAWRNEPELAEFIIAKVKKSIESKTR